MPSKRPACRIREHDWKPKGDHEVCTKCGTRFPCKNLNCGHVDCYIERGNKGTLPPGMEVVDKPSED